VFIASVGGLAATGVDDESADDDAAVVEERVS
jgi:hypothetical protein